MINIGVQKYSSKARNQGDAQYAKSQTGYLATDVINSITIKGTVIAPAVRSVSKTNGIITCYAPNYYRVMLPDCGRGILGGFPGFYRFLLPLRSLSFG